MATVEQYLCRMVELLEALVKAQGTGFRVVPNQNTVRVTARPDQQGQLIVPQNRDRFGLYFQNVSTGPIIRVSGAKDTRNGTRLLPFQIVVWPATEEVYASSEGQDADLHFTEFILVYSR